MEQLFANPRIQVNPHDFSRVPAAEIPRSSFDRSHGYKTAFDAGKLIPIFVDEVLPGDTFSLSLTSFSRMSTPIAPVMDNLYADVFFFAVPYRLVWTNFPKFMGEQANPGDSTSYLIPTVTGNNAAIGSLWDYFGLPTGIAQNIAVNALPFRAYNLIWNEWFRDENLQNAVVVSKGDGPDTYADYVIKNRGKRHDYFTSCLPWPQKGDAVELPIGTTAPVFTDAAVDTDISVWSTVATAQYEKLKANAAYVTLSGDAGTAGNRLYASLTDATAATINQFREAIQMQRLLERDARGGTRYTEIVRAHFGVVSPDARLQRPEYLGGGSRPVNMAPVPVTAITSGSTATGDLAAVGTFSHSGIGFTKSFTEHSIIIGLISVRADLNYQQGVNRMWSRSTRYDHYWPALAHIGEQAVLNKEIYAQGTATDLETFGYQERYAEYRYKPSQVTGILRSTAAGTLDLWHLAQKFTALPTLGDTFIQENPDVDRVIAVPTEPHFILDCAFKLTCARPMPVYSVPGLMDRF